MKNVQHFLAIRVCIRSSYALNSPSPLRGEGWGEGLSFKPCAGEKSEISHCEIPEKEKPGGAR
jgi:hypothetical protein